MSTVIGNCDCCHTENVVIHVHGMVNKFSLCDVCYCTRVGNTMTAPRAYGDNAVVLQTIAWGINYLAKLIKDKK